MNRDEMMEKIAISDKAPKFIQVANARGHSLYELYELIDSEYQKVNQRWGTRYPLTETVTEAYRAILKNQNELDENIKSELMDAYKLLEKSAQKLEELRIDYDVDDDVYMLTHNIVDQITPLQDDIYRTINRHRIKG